MEARRPAVVLAVLLVLVGVPARAQRSYVVAPGDTLYGVAGRFDTTVAALVSANALASDALSVGQVLKLPGVGQSGYRTVIAQSGDTLASIARRVGRRLATLRSANPGLSLDNVPAGAPVSVPPADGATAFAKPGDSLATLAARAGVSLAAVAGLNGIDAGALLPAGRAVLLPLAPAPAAISAPASEPAPGRPATAAGANVPAARPEPTAAGIGGAGSAAPVAAGGGADTTPAPIAELASRDARKRLRGLQDEALRAAVARLPAVAFASSTFEAPVHGTITSRFGWRTLAVNGNHFHAGVDIAATVGEPVHVARDGVVVKAGWGGTYGNAVFVDHGDGTQTRYAHLSRIDVHTGQRVRQGDVLGLAGSTGASTGPHVHFELRFDGRAVDPLAYLDIPTQR